MGKFWGRAIGWFAFVLTGAALALSVAWLTHLIRVQLASLLLFGGVVIGLAWLITLVTLPWNLYFAAHQATASMEVSRERGIVVRDADAAEAVRLARRMLWFALGAHLLTAVAAAAVALFTGARVGYYVAGFFLLTTAFRPAAAYLGHVRARIKILTRESTHPRDDVATLLEKAEGLQDAVDDLWSGLRQAGDDLRHSEATLAGDIGHARQLLTTDLARLQDAQAADRDAARSRNEELARRIDAMVRRIETTLDGLSDHQELLAGLRALVRMVRADQA
jgi:hypothetical protein